MSARGVIVSAKSIIRRKLSSRQSLQRVSALLTTQLRALEKKLATLRKTRGEASLFYRDPRTGLLCLARSEKRTPRRKARIDPELVSSLGGSPRFDVDQKEAATLPAMSENDIDDLRSKVNDSMRKGNFSNAVRQLHGCYARTRDPSVGFALCELLSMLGEDETAVSLLGVLADRSLPVRLRFAEILEKRGMIDDALRLWRQSREVLSSAQYSFMLQSMLKSPTATSAELLAEQTRWARRFCQGSGGNAGPILCARKTGKLRIGYHCSFWNSDTMRNQLLPILRHHDRNRFSVYAYSPVPVEDCFLPFFDGVRVTAALDDHDFVELVRRDAIDVFLECTGFSTGHRFAAMAMRCAPVQVSYLNHTGTSGVTNVDFVLADEISLRKEEQQYYSERVFYLPGSFFCFNFESTPHPDCGNPPVLKNGYVTFGCFGSNGKINPTLIAWWAEVLRRVPTAKLYVRNLELSVPENRRHFMRQMLRLGVQSERLIVRGGLPRSQLVACYLDVDISLDTWPYSGGNTVAESLWQGVPVITYRGQRFSSAYGASLLLASGCSDLVAESSEEYVERAVGLAEDPGRISRYRLNLRDLTRKNGFNDAEAFARKLEKAFLAMSE